jgi:uncharacterized protein (DUF849 family)
MDKHFILNFTPTGMIPTKRMTPHVPVQPAEIVSQICDVIMVVILCVVD